MKILLLSAYDAPSHRYWREGIIQNLQEFEFTQLTLPPRYFSWRIRGNPLSWCTNPALQMNYDLIVATSMVDLATLKGIAPALRNVPCVYYFHENQFAYPLTSKSHQSLEPQMVTLYGAMAADRLVFNSQFNRQTFLTGIEQLLAAFPDAVPQGITAKLANKSCVLAVPLHHQSQHINPSRQPIDSENPLHIIWNHRWEYDKGPEQLLAIITTLPVNAPLRWFILGQQFRNKPAAFAEIQQLLEKRGWLGHWGYIEDEQKYHEILRRGDCVISTALHDFQGLSILEAVAAGCIPLVPNRLAYPEWFSFDYCYDCGETPEIEAHAATEKIMQLCSAQPNTAAPCVAQFYWANLASEYSDMLRKTAGQPCA